ncbi:MAG: hypothetical protein KDB82_13530 [Planctomycetes bacterium]|nr:hypothetical protein [Planctomycetota bacterium]
MTEVIEPQPQRTAAKTIFGVVFMGFYGLGGLGFLLLGVAELVKSHSLDRAIPSLVIALIIGLPLLGYGATVGMLSIKGRGGGVLLGFIPSLVISLMLILPCLFWLLSDAESPFIESRFWLTFYFVNILLTVLGFVALSGGDDSRDNS